MTSNPLTITATGGLVPSQYTDELFFELPQIRASLFGHDFALPVFYRETSSISAIFPARLDRLRRLLPVDGPFMPAIAAPGVGAVGITAFSYGESSIGPYNEIGIYVSATLGRSAPLLELMSQAHRNDLSAYVWQLPVTTEIARVGGVELYGFPKFHADIRYERTGGEVAATLDADGVRVLELCAPTSNSGERTRLRYRAYSMRKGRALEAPVLVDASGFAQRLFPRGVELELGSGHPIGRTLDEVLLGRRPILTQWVPSSTAILHAPVCLR